MSASPLIDPAALQALLPSGPLVLDATVILPSATVDGDYRPASGCSAWQAGHIPGSLHADLTGAFSRSHPVCGFMAPEPDALAAALAELGAEDGRTIVLYDQADGFWAARLWWMLRGIGVDALLLDGGWRRWCAEGRSIEAGPAPVPPRGHITARPSGDLWIERDEVERVMRGEKPGTLVCALEPSAFAGKVPTRYARRGHIPGSVNLPARSLHDGTGSYRPPEELARIVADTLAPGPAVIYCGGGISAAPVALALTLLGRSDVRIYDGSLQEWSADPSLPLSRINEPDVPA
jgi:thiosulfate/3-mercaptopyruvate sulfurtransferase